MPWRADQSYERVTALADVGCPSYSSQPYSYKNIHGYLRQIFEAFGPELVMGGAVVHWLGWKRPAAA